MGLIGDLLYPDNSDLANEANTDQQQLQQTILVNNNLVTSYRILAEQIRTFDSYLMSILVMQYYLVYTVEDLENTPQTDLPQLTESLADKIESVALDAVTVKMAYGGIRALYNRIANLVREGGPLRANIGDRSAVDLQATSEELAPEIEATAAQTEIVSSSSVDLLTNTELTADQLAAYAGELGEVTAGVRGLAESGELPETSTLPDVAASASEGAEAASEVAESAEAVGEAAAEAGVEGAAASASVGAAAFLGPAIVIVIVITEIISAIDAGKTHEELLKALARLKKLQGLADENLTSLKQGFQALLSCAVNDIEAYNRVLAKLVQLEGNQTYNRSFQSSGLAAFIAGIDGISAANPGNITGLQAAAADDVQTALGFIRQHATNDSKMVEVISMIRTRVQQNGPNSANAPFLGAVATDLDLDLATVELYDNFRQFLNGVASTLAPYHQQIREQTPPGAARPATPSQPSFGGFDPGFLPRPAQFQIPGIGKSHAGG